jgi:hypothetical protein
MNEHLNKINIQSSIYGNHLSQNYFKLNQNFK